MLTLENACFWMLNIKSLVDREKDIHMQIGKLVICMWAVNVFINFYGYINMCNIYQLKIIL